MRHADLTEDAAGQLIDVESVRGEKGLAFLPDLLPVDITMTSDLASAAEEAGLALGNLNGLGHMLPNPLLFVQPFIRKEALASTRIEGTRADFGQVLLYEAQGEIARLSDPDSQEVINYSRALFMGWEAHDEWQTSKIAIAELHRVLMQGVRGQEQRPGEFRDVAVFIGGPKDSLLNSRFVPPPPHLVRELLDNLIGYAEEKPELPKLIRIAILHYQFETIHPFRDGNGRLGRLLIPLYMKNWGLLDHPLLYLSEYFERHRDAYIDHLYAVSAQGAWHDWILFFLEAIRVQANDAISRAQTLLRLQGDLRRRYSNDRSPHILAIIEKLFEDVAVTYRELEEATGATPSTVHGLVQRLIKDNVLIRAPGGRRNQVFIAEPILRVMVSEMTG